MKTLPTEASPETIREQVRERYGAIAAKPGGSCCSTAKSCCGSGSPDALASTLGYAEGDLAAIPQGANLGLSCGNPTALASLSPGEVLLDLGSGAGFDAFLAGPKVGSTGRVIGVDMTPDMITRARRNLETYTKRTGLDNIEFRLGEIEHLPVSDAMIDVIISNCVINLSPDKPQVWRDMFRVLKPGGRVAVSDLALVQALP
ncbi:MAG: arsenite methyltransferase, partial [Candidatus Hydrogenedentes bacterium]|nr:arsenite methyltransferase [Candidatus Hydrogenedentota bacterium]